GAAATRRAELEGSGAAGAVGGARSGRDEPQALDVDHVGGSGRRSRWGRAARRQDQRAQHAERQQPNDSPAERGRRTATGSKHRAPPHGRATAKIAVSSSDTEANR